MDYELKTQYYNVYRNIHQLQEKLERDIGDLAPGEKEEIRMEIIQLYLVVGERESAIFMLNDYIDQWITPRNLFNSARPVRAYVLLLLLYVSAGRFALAEEVLERFKTYIKYSGKDNVAYPSVVTYADILETIIKRDSFDKDEMLKKINFMETYYEGNRHTLPVDFAVTIYLFFSGYYFRGKEIEKALDYWKKAFAMSEIAGLRFRTSELYRQLSGMYEDVGMYKEALESYDKYCKSRNEVWTAKEYAYSEFLISEYGIKSGVDIAKNLQEKNSTVKSNKDSLTGLNNRKCLPSVINSFLKRGPNLEIHAVMFDIDFFKRYNEKYGHLKGDRVLEKIGELLGSFTSDSIVPIRYGGEEFLMLMCDQSATESEVVANTILQEILNHHYENAYSDVSKYVTLSAGMASLECNTTDDVYSLCDMAYKALGEAKSNGRNKCVRYSK